MKHFKHNEEKQNITENLHIQYGDFSAGFSGSSKAIVLACSVLIIVALLSAVPVIGERVTTEPQFAYADIALKANEKLQSSDFEEAIELFKQAIEINPNDEELYIGLADSYSGANEKSMAREVLETGYNETKGSNIKIKLDEFNNTEKQAEEIEKLMEQGRNCLSDNDNEEALKIFLDVIDRNPEYAEAYILASEIMDNEEAIELLTKGYEVTNDISIKSALDELTAVQNESSVPEQSEVPPIPSENEESSNISEIINTVSVKNFTDKNFQSYGDTEIFKSYAEWFELSSNENLIGVENINASINETLNKYFSLNLATYGFENENDIFYLVKTTGKSLETTVSARVTYNNDYILSYIVEVSVKSPDALASSATVELHTIDLKTGNELGLSDILGSDENSIRKSVTEAFNNAGIKFSESDFEELKFYLDNEKLMLIAPSGKAYISLSSIEKTKQTTLDTGKSNVTSETR